MQDDKALQLFYKILEKTRSKGLHWEATAEDGQYVAALGPGLILKTWPFTDEDVDVGEKIGPPSVTLNDENKMLLDMNHRIDGISVSDLEELLLLAKRSALNIDRTIDDVLGRLDKLRDEEDIPF
jgi:hypothetical protein